MWTKGEWKTVLSIDGVYSGTATIIFCNGDFVASTTRQHRSMNFTKEEAEANAQRIVQCVNSHDYLVETCKEALNGIISLIENMEKIGLKAKPYIECKERLQQAINKAEGK